MGEAETKQVGPTEIHQGVQVSTVEDVDAEVSEKPLPDHVDDAHKLFHGQPENFVYTAKEANRVRWKLDLILLPMVYCYAGLYVQN